MTQENDKPEDDKAKNEKPEHESGAPEVEAEVVGAEEEPASSSAAFEEMSPEIEEALAGAEEELAPRKSTLTPGVILFFAFTAVALVAFFIWWRQSGDDGRAARDAAETTAPQIETEEPAAPPGEEAPAEERTAGEEPSPSLPEPGGKIENQRTGDLPPPADTVAPDDTFLPPVSERGAEKITNNIETGALEAARRLQQQESAAPPEEEPQADETPGFDVAPDEDGSFEQKTSDAASDETSGAQAAQIAETDDATTEMTPQELRAEETIANADAAQPAVAEIPAKIVNDLETLRGETARLENALSEERERNAALSAEISELRESFETALAARDQRYTDEIADMRASLQKIQNSEIKDATDQLRANLALNALRRKVDAGEPFADELTAMAAFAPDSASALAPYAHSGAPTNAALQESFGEAARKAIAAAELEEADNGWDRVVARAKNLVSVRPAAPLAGDGPRAVISRAEHGLNEGDLTYALNELDSLPQSAKAAMADWINDAEKREKAQSVLSEISQQLNGGSE